VAIINFITSLIEKKIFSFERLTRGFKIVWNLMNLGRENTPLVAVCLDLIVFSIRKGAVITKEFSKEIQASQN
jgi:hypothetical protein